MSEVFTLVQKRITPTGIEVRLLMDGGVPLQEYLEGLGVGEVDPIVLSGLQDQIDSLTTTNATIQQSIETLTATQVVIGENLAELTDRVAAIESLLSDYAEIKAGLSEFAEALES